MKLVILLLITVLIGLVASVGDWFSIPLETEMTKRFEWMQDTPTLVPADPFVPFDDASALRKGIHRLVLFSPNAIIGVLCHRVGTQRAEVAAIYEHAYGIVIITWLSHDHTVAK